MGIRDVSVGAHGCGCVAAQGQKYPGVTQKQADWDASTGRCEDEGVATKTQRHVGERTAAQRCREDGGRGVRT